MAKRNLVVSYYVCAADRYVHRTDRGHLCPRCNQPMQYFWRQPPASRDDHQGWQQLDAVRPLPSGRQRVQRRLRQRIRDGRQMAEWERELFSNS